MNFIMTFNLILYFSILKLTYFLTIFHNFYSSYYKHNFNLLFYTPFLISGRMSTQLSSKYVAELLSIAYNQHSILLSSFLICALLTLLIYKNFTRDRVKPVSSKDKEIQIQHINQDVSNQIQQKEYFTFSIKNQLQNYGTKVNQIKRFLIKQFLLLIFLIQMVIVELCSLISFQYTYLLEVVYSFATLAAFALSFKNIINLFQTNSNEILSLQHGQNSLNQKLQSLVPKVIKDHLERSTTNQSFQHKQKNVSLLFCFITNYETLVNQEKINVIKIVDKLFKQFDQLCHQFAVQKIQNVGSAYVASTGIQIIEDQMINFTKNQNQVKRLFQMANKMMNIANSISWGLNKQKKINLKIGIHHGEVIITIIGHQKPQFCLVGDAMNTTSRHCSAAQVGDIILSQKAYEVLGQFQDENFNIKYKMMKGLGKIQYYQYIKSQNYEDYYSLKSNNKNNQKNIKDIIKNTKSELNQGNLLKRLNIKVRIPLNIITIYTILILLILVKLIVNLISISLQNNLVMLVAQSNTAYNILYGSLIICLIHLINSLNLKNLQQVKNLKQLNINKQELLTKLLPQHISQKFIDEVNRTSKNFNQITKIENQLTQIDQYQNCTILYADLKGFTQFSKNHQKKPEIVVQMLKKLYQGFEKICLQNNIHKLYTIGDCYVLMGLTNKQQRNYLQQAKNVVNTATEMIQYIQKLRQKYHLKELNMRIGIHTGKVMGGIVGKQLVRYDIYGVDVLIANYFQQQAEAGLIHISQSTIKILDKQVNSTYQFEFKNKIQLSKLNLQLNGYYISKKNKKMKPAIFNLIYQSQ